MRIEVFSRCTPCVGADGGAAAPAADAAINNNKPMNRLNTADLREAMLSNIRDVIGRSTERGRNFKAIVAQRLIRTVDGKGRRAVASEGAHAARRLRSVYAQFAKSSSDADSSANKGLSGAI
jgi:hypothetical protein